MARTPTPANLARTITDHLEQEGRCTPAAAELARELRFALVEARELREAVHTTGLTVTGSTGQLVVHPGLLAADRAVRRAIDLAKVLGIDPASIDAAGASGEPEAGSLADLFAVDELAPRRSRMAP